MANGSAADVIRKVADGELQPEEGAEQLRAFFGGDIQAEAAGDPRVQRVDQLITLVQPETTPGVTIITIIVTIKRC